MTRFCGWQLTASKVVGLRLLCQSHGTAGCRGCNEIMQSKAAMLQHEHPDFIVAADQVGNTAIDGFELSRSGLTEDSLGCGTLGLSTASTVRLQCAKVLLFPQAHGRLHDGRSEELCHCVLKLLFFHLAQARYPHPMWHWKSHWKRSRTCFC